MIRYEPTRPDDGALRQRLRDLAGERCRFGYRRMGYLLAREGMTADCVSPTTAYCLTTNCHCGSEVVNQGLVGGFLELSAETLDILVVDLDGTLLRSDMLYEGFWSAFGRDWRSPFLSTAALVQGRASLKRHLATTANVDASTLPYDGQIIAFIEQWREAGGRTALVTASDHRLAEAIAQHLDLFDEVHGSDGTWNLKGERKAQFLEQNYGIGDFPTWAMRLRICPSGSGLQKPSR